MKKLNVYTVYLDDGKDTFKATVPAENAKAAERYCNGNGEVIKVKKHEEGKDLTNIDLGYLANTLERDHWGDEEIKVIVRALEAVGLKR